MLAVIATTPLLKPVTGCGAGLGLLLPLLVGLPSWPLLFKPQHVTAPAVLSAQVWSPLAETWVTVGSSMLGVCALAGRTVATVANVSTTQASLNNDLSDGRTVFPSMAVCCGRQPAIN